MKNYRILVPIIMVGCLAASWYQLINKNMQDEKKYQAAITQARENAEQGITTEAIACYDTALELKPSLDLYKEIGKFYEKYGDEDMVADWNEKIYTVYPKETEAYMPAFEYALKKEDYVTCFALYDTIKSRAEVTEDLQNDIDSIAYTYGYFGSNYDETGIFENGYCSVKKDDMWSFVDVYGNLIMDSAYSEVSPFTSSLAPVVTTEGEVYFIDNSGNKKMIPPEDVNAKSISGITDKVYCLYDGSGYTYYDSDKKKLMGPFEYAGTLSCERAIVKESGTWHIIDSSGNMVSENQYKDVVFDESGRTFVNDRAFVSDGSRYTLIDKEGNIVGSDSFEEAKSFNTNGELAAVKKDGKWGFVDMNGEIKIACQYDDAKSFSVGLAAVKNGNRWGFINSSGDVLIDYKFEDASYFNKSATAFVKEDGSWKIIGLYKYNH